MEKWEPFVDVIATNLQLRPSQVRGTIRLLEEGNTVPFITRYRKEVTGGLDEEQIRAVQEQYKYFLALEERRQTILDSIREQGKLTPELEQKIQQATKLKTLEDLYLPYRPKKRTLATIAKEKGLEPLAEMAKQATLSEEEWQKSLEQIVQTQEKVNTVEEALEGVQHILAEWISETKEVRDTLRKIFWEDGLIETSPTPEEKDKEQESKFRDYFQFQQKVSEIPPHRILAIGRGEREKALRVKVTIPEEKALRAILHQIGTPTKEPFRSLWERAAKDSLSRLLHPSLSREVRSELTEKAEKHALSVFGKNLRQVLLAPPVRNRRILGIDPGYRTGCKLAAVDEFGNLLEVGVMYPHEPQGRWEEAKKILAHFVEEHKIDLIAIGNGTAHRETEELVSEFLSESASSLEYLIVNEAGASVYSASKEAQEEFPELDASYRGTVSIARRVQDPLAEIVKIDPKSMGVGLYQHDVSPKALKSKVEEVVESCVNYVGVDVNTASVSLLRHVSGLNRLQARRIYEHRRTHGPFRRREDLRQVRGIGSETFTQAAGFLRIPDGDDPLDATPIHPESYDKARKLLQHLGFSPEDLRSPQKRQELVRALDRVDIPQMAQQLDVGVPTLTDIVESLKKPGRDPREDLPKPVFRKGIMRLEDLKVGMELTGTVRNVVDFGAFVDIGLKEDGLVHISELSDEYVRSPHEVVSVGDVIRVRVIDIDPHRRRIALSCRAPEKSAKKKGKKSSSSPSAKASSAKSSPTPLGGLGALLQKELGKKK